MRPASSCRRPRGGHRDSRRSSALYPVGGGGERMESLNGDGCWCGSGWGMKRERETIRGELPPGS
eukprot:scaffold2822_cov100-Isochrysis_galbana.AAC.9